MAAWLRAPRGAAGMVVAATVGIAAVAFAVVGMRAFLPDDPAAGLMQPAAGAVMLILRGIASPDAPRGQLDDAAALEYARRLGYRGEVLDVAGDTGADSEQVRVALDRIRRDDTVAAIYGFSGGGYNARTIWSQLSAQERKRIGRIVVVGSPGVTEGSFPGGADVVVKPDPPEGHMAGPKALLETVGRR